MFMFNAWDCYGNEYVCLFKDGAHRVYLIDGEESYEVFVGSYGECSEFVDLTLLVARESLF